MDEDIVRKVWEKGQIVSGNDSQSWRKDQCGAWIGWQFYGNRNSQYGWEIDHINPQSNGGGDELYNLRPLQWENNASKKDGQLICSTISSDIKNIKKY